MALILANVLVACTLYAYPLEAFGKRMLHHTADKCVHLHRFPFHPLALV